MLEKVVMKFCVLYIGFVVFCWLLFSVRKFIVFMMYLKVVRILVIVRKIRSLWIEVWNFGIFMYVSKSVSFLVRDREVLISVILVCDKIFSDMFFF